MLTLLQGIDDEHEDEETQEWKLAKRACSRLLLDARPLLSVARSEVLTEDAIMGSFRRVFTMLIDRMPGEPLGEDAGHEGTLQELMVTRVQQTTLVRSDRP